jgi:hypothetical protein
MSVTTGSGEVLTGHYVAQEVFKNGSGSTDVMVRKRDHCWKIDGWRMNSTETMTQAAGRST